MYEMEKNIEQVKKKNPSQSRTTKDVAVLYIDPYFLYQCKIESLRSTQVSAGNLIIADFRTIRHKNFDYYI